MGVWASFFSPVGGGGISMVWYVKEEVQMPTTGKLEGEQQCTAHADVPGKSKRVELDQRSSAISGWELGLKHAHVVTVKNSFPASDGTEWESANLMEAWPCALPVHGHVQIRSSEKKALRLDTCIVYTFIYQKGHGYLLYDPQDLLPILLHDQHRDRYDDDNSGKCWSGQQ
jgi:hypothetical protein